jgi:uncharacterized protein (TIGR02246 family)
MMDTRYLPAVRWYHNAAQAAGKEEEMKVKSHIDDLQDDAKTDEGEVRRLYWHLLEAWNNQDAGKMAALFADEGHVIGFDGSLMNGRMEIEAVIKKIFADHKTAAYVGIIQAVEFLTPQVALLRAVAGMVPPGQIDINPEVNTIQSLVAFKQRMRWAITLYQNTPAQFHGRPELVQQLTNELRQQL